MTTTPHSHPHTCAHIQPKHAHTHGTSLIPYPFSRLTFLSKTNAALRDPHCGDRVCTAPLEFAGWHNDQFGCSSDCGDWHNTTKLRVHLTLDPSLPQEDVEEIRWNMFCTDVEVFRMEMRVFAEDQTFLDVDAEFDEVMDLIDCNYDLRIYAPKGGVDGSLTFVGAKSNTTRFTTRKWLHVVIVCMPELATAPLLSVAPPRPTFPVFAKCRLALLPSHARVRMPACMHALLDGGGRAVIGVVAASPLQCTWTTTRPPRMARPCRSTAATSRCPRRHSSSATHGCARPPCIRRSTKCTSTRRCALRSALR
jgi:hypothetical protein